jgi:hypothetical protein
MAKYFNYFPKTIYNLDDSGSLDSITNLTINFSFDKNILENAVLYYEYDVQDGETPEVVAHKVYGSSEKHWIILKMNDVYDVKNDWVLGYEPLIESINLKYSNVATTYGQTGIEWAKANTHSYYMIETRTLTGSGEVTVDEIQIDANTYANVSVSSNTYVLPDSNPVTVTVSKKFKTYYEYEIDEKEKKRSIKILRPEYISPIETEFREIMRNG